MTTSELIQKLIKKGWLPLKAILLALQAEEDGDVKPDQGGSTL